MNVQLTPQCFDAGDCKDTLLAPTILLTEKKQGKHNMTDYNERAVNPSVL